MFENAVAAIIFFTMLGIVVVTILAVLVHQFRYAIWSGYYRAVFTGQDKRVSSILMKIDKSDKDFEITHYGKVYKYGIDKDRIYYIGRFSLATAYYVVGDAVPKDMLDPNSTSEISAIEYAQVARNTVTRDLLAAFDTKFLSPQNIMTITLIVLAVGFLGLGLFVNDRFGKLEDQINPPPTGIVNSNPPTSEDLAGELK